MALEIPRADRNDLVGQPPTGRASTSRDHRRDVYDPPDDVLALLDHHLLEFAGTYGDPNLGDPTQYDALRIEHDQGDVEIVVYNRVLLRTDDEVVRRIHQVCCRLDDLAARG